MQPQAVPVSVFSILTKPTSRKTIASYDMAPDTSYNLDSGGVIARGFCGPSNHQRDQTMLRNSKLQIQPQAVLVSHLFILTKPTSRKTVTSCDMSPDPLSALELHSDQYVSNQYILDRNPRLSSYTIGVTYTDYISLLLVCGDFPLTSKRGVCWNLIPDSLD